MPVARRDDAIAAMELVHEDGERRIWSARLERPYRFVSPVRGSAFALLLVVIDDSIGAAEQNGLSSEFVLQGCRSACCAGHACSSWDDSIDWAYLDTCTELEPRDANFVMTTWHEGEALDDAAWCFIHCSAFDDFVPREFLILCLGGDETDEHRIVDVVRNALE
jgi:hypothetical protein